MTKFHNNQLNMISLHDNDSYSHSTSSIGTNISNMSSPTASQPELEFRPNNYTISTSSGNDNDCVDQTSEFFFSGGRIEEGALNTGSWDHGTSYSNADLDPSLYTGPFHSTQEFVHSQTNQYAPTSINSGIMKRSEPAHLVDCMDDHAFRAALHKEIHGTQQGNDGIGKPANIKLEEITDGSQSASFTSSFLGERDEDDGSEFGDSQAKSTLKTNKDGGVRKPRQPRAKLLKWSDNDWKNVVLGIVWACGETGVQIPFDQAAQIVGESCTAGALQQAVLKLRQKQVADGNFIPSLRMAWTRKSKNSDSADTIADGQKITSDKAKTKTLLPKRKPTRFSGNQTLMVTLKRAYIESDRMHLEFPYNIFPQVMAPFLDDGIHQFGDLGGIYTDSGLAPDSVQKRRGNYHVPFEGSPLSSQGLYVDMSKDCDWNGKPQTHDSELYRNFVVDSPENDMARATMPTPSLTIDSGFCTQLGTPASNVSPDCGHLMSSNGINSWNELPQITPQNLMMANEAVVPDMEPHFHNPQGTQYNGFPTSSFGDASFVDADTNLDFSTVALADPFWEE